MSCISVSQLMVSDITFSNVEKSSFQVSWTGPAGHASHVSRYSVSWTPKGSGSGVINTALSTTTSVTGLPTQGAVYTVTITTYNDDTQVDNSRLITSHKEQATSKLLNLATLDESFCFVLFVFLFFDSV